MLSSGLDDSERFTTETDLFGEIGSSPPTTNQSNTGPEIKGILGVAESNTDNVDMDVDTNFDNMKASLDAALLDGDSDDEDGSDDEGSSSDEDWVDDASKVMTVGATADKTDVGEGIGTPGAPGESCATPVPFQAGCIWVRKDWSCAYDAVFMVFFAMYWQSPASWRNNWRQQSPEWTIQLADHFDLLLGDSDTPDHSPEKLSKLFSSLRDQFRDQLSTHDPQRFPRRGPIPTSVCAILELLFGPAREPGIKQHLFCTNCGTTSQISRSFSLLAFPVFPTNYRRNTDPRFVPATTLMARFIDSLAIPSSSPRCHACHSAMEVQSLSMEGSPWLWFETKGDKGDHTMSPSLTMPIELFGQHLIYDLHSIIYIGGNHFAARMRDLASNEWWSYDGMWKFGVSRHDRIQITEDLLYSGRRQAAFLIYRHNGY